MLAMPAPVSGITVTVSGCVQGIGFRPFVCRLAVSEGITGKVRNTRSGVVIEATGTPQQLERFVMTLQSTVPAPGRIDHLDVQPCQHAPSAPRFIISDSEQHGYISDVLPDMAMCDTCRDEMQSTSHRLSGYLFNSCPQCGPRFSMIRHMPYDRDATAMDAFALCAACQQDYASQTSRRFHTEGIGCPQCGPGVTLLDNQGQQVEDKEQDVIRRAAEWLRQGRILAVKGIGGFHLCVRAQAPEAIALLRERKHRPAKPLAVMMQDIAQVQRYFRLTAAEVTQLCSPAAPVVLLPKQRQTAPLPENIAPDVDCVGVMLAYTALHLELIRAVGEPVIMTSGNQNGAPLCTDNDTALRALAGIADGWLMHNREIVRGIDDSVVKVVSEEVQVLRRARGFVPAPLQLPQPLVSGSALLAMGADIKNTLAVARDNKVVLSGHNGDLQHPDCYVHAKDQAGQLCALLGARPQAIVIDKHPDYFSSKLGRELAARHDLPVIAVQHHHAHMAACLAENGVTLSSPVLGIVLDGSGYGDDGTMWGGELLLADYQQSVKAGGLKPYTLLGGDKASRQPWRNLVALLHQAEIDLNAPWRARYETLAGALSPLAFTLVQHAEQGVMTSSAGRLFDAVAALLGVAPATLSYEGQAAMRLEALAGTHDATWPVLPFDLYFEQGQWQLDPRRFMRQLCARFADGAAPALLAAWFHEVFAASWVALVDAVCQHGGYRGREIALSGGVFQNARLLMSLQTRLEAQGFTVYRHRRVPAGDGGIALGQSIIGQHCWRAN
ncbi:carbamoyltransferase HypF [Alteromonas sp. CYL-A6]|uniref:carbamoyltransferase HypF n=1 Tax=Alteromonas nitratireducens TaxID=3390813 RepID=UPI0034BA93BE